MRAFTLHLWPTVFRRPHLVALIAITALGFVNPLITADVFRFPHAVDWEVYVEASYRLGSDQLYAWPDGYDWCEHCAFRYSPIFAWIIGLLEPIGIEGWRILHGIVLPLLGWPLALTAALAWPFWQDMQVGNVVTFALVAGSFALRGNRWGTGLYFAIAILTPRPFLLPLVVWLIWKRPQWRWPVGVALVAQFIIVTTLGYMDDWVVALLGTNLDFGASYDYGPARLFGSLWPVVGVPLAAWLTWKGRIGMASLAIQPYWLGYYLLMVLLDLVPRRSSVR